MASRNCVAYLSGRSWQRLEGTKARSAWPCPSYCRSCRESSYHSADRLGVTALNPQHDATGPLDFHVSRVSLGVTDDLHGDQGLVR